MGRIACLLLLLPALLSSATISGVITSGSADLTANGLEGTESFSVSGPGFSYTGQGRVSEYSCGPFAVCRIGTQIPSWFAGLSSEDRGMQGIFTFGSTSINYGYGIGDPRGGGGIEYSFHLSTPATNPPAILTLMGPFTAVAYFASHLLGVDSSSFTGSGMVTIDLTLSPFGGVYELQRMHFDFSSVPEPGAGTLVLAGIVVIGVQRFKRKK